MACISGAHNPEPPFSQPAATTTSSRFHVACHLQFLRAKQKLLNLKHGPKNTKKTQMCLVHYEKVTLCHIDKIGSIQISFHPAGTKTTSPGCATPQIKCFGFCVRYCQGGRSAGRLPPCFFPFVPCPKRGIDGGWSSRPHWGFPPMVQSIDIIL
jgi:hypothetical protein